MNYIGLGNFYKMFRSDYFWQSLYNTSYLWAIMVPLRTFLALIIAVILSSSFIKFKPLFRTLIILPFITAAVIVSIIFMVVFTYHGGTLNIVLGKLGIKPVPWLNSVEWSKISVAIVVIWRELGYWSIIMMGGLQRIPRDLYEAAVIDGANKFKAFWKITVPLMRPVILFVVVMSTIYLFRLFTEPFLLTHGGPRHSSYTLAQLLYDEAFNYLRHGYAASIGFFTFMLIFAISSVQMKIGQG